MNHQCGANCDCGEYAHAEEYLDLFSNIDQQNIITLNESVTNSGKKIFYEIKEKYNKNLSCSSDCDGEIIFIIPFNTRVKITSVSFFFEGDDSYAEKAKFWINENNVDFTFAEETKPTMELDLVQDCEYALKQSKFNNVAKLIIHLKSEVNDPIIIRHIGLKGQDLKIKDSIVNAIYEANAIPKDHNVNIDNKQGFDNY